MKNGAKNLLILSFLLIGFAPAAFAADPATTTTTTTNTATAPVQVSPPTEVKKSNSADMMDKMNMKEHAKMMKAGALAPGEKISLNNGTKADLEKLPGIGPAKADAIIKARPFKSVEDITKVKGIKNDTYAKIKNNIVL